MVRLRTKVLNALGATPMAFWWARAKCAKCDVQVRRRDGALELQKGSQTIRILPKHIFFAPEICGAFGSFAGLMAEPAENGATVIDLTRDPSRLNLARECLRRGATLEIREGCVWLRKDERAMLLAERHLIYTPDLAERFDMYFDPLVPEVREGMRVLDFSRPGILQRYAKSGVEFEMASWPEEEEAIEEYFHWYRPKTGDLVFDVGAHCGVSTYHLSKLVGPQGRVIAFEPDPGNFELLERNMRRHGLENVSLQQAAIAGESGKLAFSAEGTIGSALSTIQGRDSVGATVIVDVMTLAQAFTMFGTPQFCKLDIEGAEIDAVAVAKKVIAASGTNFALDTSHLQPNGEPTKDRIERLFQSCGYDTASEAKPLWTTWARPREGQRM